MASVEYKKISQATVRDEIWFMTRVDVVAADGTVALCIRRMDSCRKYINFSDYKCVRISYLQAYNSKTRASERHETCYAGILLSIVS